MTSHERCCECDDQTGRAGRHEDSLYAGSDGPYCESCWNDLPNTLALEVSRLRAAISMMRDGTEIDDALRIQNVSK